MPPPSPSPPPARRNRANGFTPVHSIPLAWPSHFESCLSLRLSLPSLRLRHHRPRHRRHQQVHCCRHPHPRRPPPRHPLGPRRRLAVCGPVGARLASWHCGGRENRLTRHRPRAKLSPAVRAASAPPTASRCLARHHVRQGACTAALPLTPDKSKGVDGPLGPGPSKLGRPLTRYPRSASRARTTGARSRSCACVRGAARLCRRLTELEAPSHLSLTPNLPAAHSYKGKPACIIGGNSIQVRARGMGVASMGVKLAEAHRPKSL